MPYDTALSDIESHPLRRAVSKASYRFLIDRGWCQTELPMFLLYSLQVVLIWSIYPCVLSSYCLVTFRDELYFEKQRDEQVSFLRHDNFKKRFIVDFMQ